MRWGRIVLAAIAVTVFKAVYGMVTCGWLFKWVYALPPIEVWKPVARFTPIFWAIMLVAGLFFSFLLAMVYGWIYKGIPGKCRCCKGSAYGLIIWLTGVLPGMFSMRAFSVISPTVIIYWTIDALVALQLIGMLISWIYGKTDDETGTCCH